MAIKESGSYKAKAVDWGFNTTRNGNPELVIEFAVPMPDGSKEMQFAHLYFTEGAFDRAVESLRIMGWKGEELSELDNKGGGIDANEVSLEIEMEKYEGKVTPKVQWINSGSGGHRQAPLTGDALKAFSFKMKSRVASADAKNKAKREERAAAKQATSLPGNGAKKDAAEALAEEIRPSVPGDNDIPF